MTIKDILAISPEDLARLTDAELEEKLAPLIPLARAEYIGKRTETVIAGPAKVSKREWNKKIAALDKILAAQSTLPQ